ncbi:hypothetical protein ACLOJK_003213 [Asimina triloba]
MNQNDERVKLHKAKTREETCVPVVKDLQCNFMWPEDPKSHVPRKITGDVELEDVVFAYPSRPNTLILDGFSLSMEAGKSIASVGESGGVVKIDGKDTKSYRLRSLRKYIALASQELTLFSGTIRENIACGITEHNVTEADVMEAALAANTHEFISSFEDGYETRCGERRVKLSGGQKQRVAIARAILKKAEILLLDEATSTPDGVSEKVVQEAVERVMVERTCLVVPHRLSTVQKCGKIAVVQKGEVVEEGSQESLISVA